MKDSISYRYYGIAICLIIGIVLTVFISGCTGVKSRTNLSINVPEKVEVFDRDVKVLPVEITSLDADAENVIVNLSAPPEISLTDPHTYLQKYDKQLKKISKGKKEITLLNYSTVFPGKEYNLILEVAADNANRTEYTIKIDSMIPAPEWEVGEFWVVNKTGDTYGTHIQQVMGKELQDGKYVYVVKDTLAREANGTYRLYYYIAEDLAHIKTEYYEDGVITERMTEVITPPSSIYGFPLMVGKTWNWSGTVSGIGQVEFKGEVLGKEKISVQGRNYEAFKIRLKYVLPLGTSDWDIWYPADLKGVIRENGTLSMGGLIKEDTAELVQYGLPSNQPPDIQPVLQTPSGWKTYVDTDKRFSFNYPSDWKEDASVKNLVVFQNNKKTAGVMVFIEQIEKMTLDDYANKVRNDIYTNLGKIYYEEIINVNGRKGYDFAFDLWTGGYGRAVAFTANGKGYMIYISPQDSYSTFEKIHTSFIFKELPVYTLLERK